jgi:DNA polymerase-1
MAPTTYPQGVPPGVKRIAIVGEAPGFAEATYGRPFTGPSGKLLTEVLRYNGFRRSEVMLTNVCLCRPPDNATPPRAAVAACRERLARELAGFNPTDIVALGGTAGTLLADARGTITALRVGPPKQPAAFIRNYLAEESSVRVIPTWHPAYCLRTADAFPALVSDIGKINDSEREPWREPEWRAFDDAPSALEALEFLYNVEGPLVIDIEVGFDKDVDFDHPNNYGLLCVGIAYARGRGLVLGETALADDAVGDGLRKVLRETASGERRRLIAHNGKFDLAGLYPYLTQGGRAYDAELWFDTMLASYALDERPGNHGLKVLAVEKLGAPKYDDEIKKYIPRRGNYGNIPRPILYKYNAFDVACTWDLYELFSEMLERQDLRRVHDFMVAASNQLIFLELNGITIDREYMSKLSDAYLERLYAIEQQLDDIVVASTGHLGEDAWLHINPRSPKQVKDYLATQGVRVVSTNEETLKALRERLPEGSPRGQFVRILLGYRRQHKLYSTYIAGFRKRMYRGRIYTTYLLHGTTSGRLASRNPNLQNIVRDSEIRRQFAVSRPENVLVQCDYANAEARVMAVLAQDEHLREILSNQTPGYKFFNVLSDQLYGAGKWGKEEYIRTKAFFYGIGYGREAYSIAMEYKVPVAEAERQYNEFLGLFPGVMAWQDSVRAHVKSGKPLISPFGRRRRFWLITDQNLKDVFNEALSYLPQSTASDICLASLTRVRPMLRGLGFLRLTIHDALVAECPESKVDEVSELLSTVMAEEGAKFSTYVPWPVDTSVGKSWGDL